MRFSLQLPTDRVEQGAEFVSADAIAEMARATEAAGFDACYVTEHPFPSDDWLATGGHHALDPFVALSAAAAATRDLRELESIGVTWLSLGLPGRSCAAYCENAARFGEEVIRKLR